MNSTEPNGSYTATPLKQGGSLPEPAMGSGARPLKKLMLSVSDGKYESRDGVYRFLDQRLPDTLVVFDASVFPPLRVKDIEVQHTVLAPPFSVALHPSETLALVSAPVRTEAADPAAPEPLAFGNVTVRPAPATWKIVLECFLQVVDLEQGKVTARVALPEFPIGVSINRAGSLALVAHASGLVSVLSIDGGNVTLVESVRIGGERAFVGVPVFTPDGRWALATKRGEHTVAVMSIEGKKVSYTQRDLSTGNSPYSMDVSPDGFYAAAANIGRGTGDADSVSLIDLTRLPFRVSDHFAVGQTPEALAISPDGQRLVVAIQNGANRPKGDPFRNDGGKLLLYAVRKGRAFKLAEARSGTNTQGVSFAPDGRHVFVQNYAEGEIAAYRVLGDGLEDTGVRVAVPGFPAALTIVR